MRTLFKCLGIFPLLLFYVFIVAAVHLFPIPAGTKRNFTIRAASLTARILILLLGIRIHVKCRDRLNEKNRGYLIISNHLSYVDVLVLSSLVPSLFITYVELKNNPLLGTIAKLGGSIFVERRKTTHLKKEIESIAYIIKQGFPVVLFPEGTTSNGDRVMQFKNSFFASAVVAQADILPICLRYTRVNNERVTPQNRDTVFYYGKVTFFQHVPRLLSRKSIDVEVTPLRAIQVRIHHSRKDLAAMAHNAISTAYHVEP